MSRDRRGNFITLFFAGLLSYLTYMVVIATLQGPMGDYGAHLYVFTANYFSRDFFEAWMSAPHMLWHVTVLFLNHFVRVPWEAAAAYTTCFFSLFAFFVRCWMFCKWMRSVGKEGQLGKAAVVAFALSVVQGLYFYWVDVSGRYLGVFSPNALHSPTHMCVQGFALLAMCLVYDIWQMQKDGEYKGIFFRVEQGLKKYYIFLAVLLLLSVLAKPTFAEMFIPAVGILMLAEYLRKVFKKETGAFLYFKNCLKMLLCSVPSLLYIGVSFLVYFILGGSYYGEGGQVMITPFGQVWSLFSENIVLSIALGMAFPLFMLLIDPHYFFGNDLGRLALTGYLVGLLEGAFLGESGQKIAHANFLWPTMAGMLLLWTVAVMRFAVLEETQSDTGRKRLLLSVASILLIAHVFSGISYIRELTVGYILW